MEYTKVLYDEHEVILSAVEIAKDSENLLNKNPEKWKEFCIKLIYFFRHYADKYHHHKEEELLFQKISEENEVMGINIIAEMLENHEDFREYISDIEDSLEVDVKIAFSIDPTISFSQGDTLRVLASSAVILETCARGTIVP